MCLGRTRSIALALPYVTASRTTSAASAILTPAAHRQGCTATDVRRKPQKVGSGCWDSGRFMVSATAMGLFPARPTLTLSNRPVALPCEDRLLHQGLVSAGKSRTDLGARYHWQVELLPPRLAEDTPIAAWRSGQCVGGEHRVSHRILVSTGKADTCNCSTAAAR